MRICTMASHSCQSLEQLLHSCKSQNIRLDILGLNEPFSFGKKMRDVKEYVQHIPDKEVVLFVDAFDTLILAEEEAILDQFLSLDAPFVCSAEIHCHPFKDLGAYYPSSPTKFKYINSGSYIGYAGYLKKFFEKISPIPDIADDQGIFTLYYFYYPNEWKLDYSCNLFLSLYQIEQSELSIDANQKKVRCLTTNTHPCVIHGNGSSKWLYQHIYDQIFATLRR